MIGGVDRGGSPGHERALPAPLEPALLDPVLSVIEAAQSLALHEDVADMLADLSRQITELLGASGSVVSVLDERRLLVRDRAGYAQPPHRFRRQAEEYRLEEYPRTAAVVRGGAPYACRLGTGTADPAEAATLEKLGFRSLLMVALPVEGRTYGLIEVYDASERDFTAAEVRLCQALANEAGTMVARARMAEQLEDAYFATLGALAAALEAKDAYTSDHAYQIAELAGAVCEQLDVDAAQARLIRLGALLHDIGKIGVPGEILRKPAPLTKDEFRTMQRHCEIGARILEPVPFFADVVPLVRSSHERWDGTGYPDGLSGDAIPLGARIIAVCDAFHAMTEDRVYRRALSVEGAMAEIQRCTGTQFDPRAASALLSVLRAQETPRGARERFLRLADQVA
jgi:putative nucleotidyltransferase with HDIG domain